MNVTNAVDRFYRQLAANGRSPHTRAAYRRDLREDLARWPQVPSSGKGSKPNLGRITPDVIARLLCSDAVLLTSGGKPRAAITVNPPREDLRPHQIRPAVVLRLLCGIGVDQWPSRPTRFRVLLSTPAG